MRFLGGVLTKSVRLAQWLARDEFDKFWFRQKTTNGPNPTVSAYQ